MTEYEQVLKILEEALANQDEETQKRVKGFVDYYTKEIAKEIKDVSEEELLISYSLLCNSLATVLGINM